MPHLLGAAQEYTKLVKGLKPNREKHKIFIDIQHLTGVPLRGGKRVQFNMFLKQINKITLTENLTTSLVPALWVEEGIQLNQEMVQTIKTKLINILVKLDAVHWTFFTVGLVTVIASIVLYIMQNRSDEKE